MKLQITESQLKLIVNTLNEDYLVKQGTGRDPYKYAKIGTKYFVAKKGTSNWIEVSGKAKIAVANLFKNDQNNTVNKKDKVKKGTSNKEDFKGIVISDDTSKKFTSKLDPKKLSTTSSVPIFGAGQDQCAQFVNDFSNKVGYVGDAWLAHNNRGLGSLVYSAFENLDEKTSKEIISLWQDIDTKGGGVKNGTFKDKVARIVSRLVPSKPPVNLQLDDVVGIFYPPSSYHEFAFYNAGKPYFKESQKYDDRKKDCSETEDPKKCNQNVLDKQVEINDTCKSISEKLIEDGQLGNKTTTASKMCKVGSKQPGRTILNGDGWGMNTHVGIVGAIKNGVPIIFHNIHGQVYADPVTKLKDGGRVAWVRRPSGNFIVRKFWEFFS